MDALKINHACLIKNLIFFYLDSPLSIIIFHPHLLVTTDPMSNQQPQTIRVDFQTCPEFWLELDVFEKNGIIKIIGKRGRCPLDLNSMRFMGKKYGRLLHSNENIMVQVDGEYDMEYHMSDDDDDEEEGEEEDETRGKSNGKSDGKSNGKSNGKSKRKSGEKSDGKSKKKATTNTANPKKRNRSTM